MAKGAPLRRLAVSALATVYWRDRQVEGAPLCCREANGEISVTQAMRQEIAINNPSKNNPMIKTRDRLFAIALICAGLAACGGGGGGTDSSGGTPPPPTTTPPPNTTPPPPAPPLPPIGSTLTTLQIENTAAAGQDDVPVTFGQVFAAGEFPSGAGLTGVFAGTQIPLQVDIKASHADGSVRHAVVSALLAQLKSGRSGALALATTATPSATTGVTPNGLLAGGFTAEVRLDIGGQVHTASAQELLQSGGYTTWLSGPLVNEWHVSAPVKTAGNVAHPHLAARFAIRSYTGTNRVRVDVTLENNWAYEPDPKNFAYDAVITVNGQQVYSKPALTHYHHARWRQTFWAGAEPKIHVRHDPAHLIASKAIPNYDQSITVSSSKLAAVKTSWDAADKGPMGMALLSAYMPATGGRPDIGLQHAWAAMYVLSMDARAKEVTLGLSDLAGSWPIHYRDKNTGQPVSIAEYPYARTYKVSSDSYNPVKKRNEDLPTCTAAGLCSTPYTPDAAHQPSLAYLPYLVTGDAYHLEELHFWANWNLLGMNPYYRELQKGLHRSEQVRGQAWSLRTLGHAAYITPDGHPMKAYFNRILQHNLAHYNATFAAGKPNQLGFIDAGYAVVYGTPAGPDTGVAPWQDDFFTSSVGHLYELGFAEAKPILDWKAQFPVGRMTAPGYCWIDGASYSLTVRPGASSAFFTTFAEAFQATMRASDNTDLVNSKGARYLDQACGSQAQADWRTQYDRDTGAARQSWKAGEMTGYASSTAGYPSNMQPALAMAATTGIPNAAQAWTLFIQRSVKPDYGTEPQFAIVPRP